ncbi:hypothetical protein LBE40_00125 [Bartonella taylorii]|uniref:Uncharacterized protein n=1 Tax=Bartonella taylorii 8TBB TaxID=1094560 RepID=A0A9P2S120_BARTA|nr:hypothetical protein [Bartonella taylorii]EJF97804.1 hypothetical protein ME9_00070 [Bartonella taylorii 8TBB]USP01294.1 hypothetical protein LBE40_00125 [Bartonella taylorii]
MTIDKTQHESFQKQGERAFVSQGALDKESKLLFFKKWMALSMGDTVIIFCLAVILLVTVGAISYINPLDFFHVLSKEQLQAMSQETIQNSFIENFKKFFGGEGLLSGAHMEKMWRAAGWNGVFAFICLIPNTIFGYLVGLFPGIFFLHIMLNRALKEMFQELEKSLLKKSFEQSDKSVN